MEPQYLCVCVLNFPAQALLRLRVSLRNHPVAVLEGNPPLERVCSVNRSAQKQGVAIGMTRVEAETLAGANVLIRSTTEEVQARQAVLECAGRYSPSVEEPARENTSGKSVRDEQISGSASSYICVLDITGTEKLFGPPHELAQKLRIDLTNIGIYASLAGSTNYHTAVATARACSNVTIVPSGEEARYLGKLPLGVLDLSQAHVSTLCMWGIKSLGALADLPEVELISRFGQEGKRMLQLAKGVRPHLFRPLELKNELKETFVFDAPVEILDSLLFVLSPMIDQLLVRARRHAHSLTGITTHFTVEGGAEHIRSIRPATPTDDRKLLLKLIQLDMEAHPPHAAVIAMTMHAETGQAAKVQLGLFSPQLPEASRLDVTLARLSAIVGEGRVGSPQLQDTHQPDSFQNSSFKVLNAKPDVTEDGSRGTRPSIRRIRPPEPLQLQLVSEQPGSFAFRNRRYIVRAAYGPWRESGAWWSVTRWSREEWDIMAETPGKDARLCCLITHDLMRRQWLIEALYD
ncbi:MAG TPA: DNA polymerase Y family protein [Acidisarcina sp.]